ncbi:hypothetical protein [Nocardia vermiculata]|uniref:Uncharacterized protein n=1 Tax=Nocardia vermiculata TaxID=257274 RepID=A0A846Y6D4_9NOCA|nr:hypothetical protein [Nocardia vermiculata]NKY53895.1 hypothetical protein [Nocardia vermiculata]
MTTIRIGAARDLAATVSVLSEHSAAPIGAQALVFVLITRGNEVEGVWSCDEIDYFDRANAAALARHFRGRRAIAFVVDNTTADPATAAEDHDLLISEAGYALAEHAITLTGVYVTTGLAPGASIWSHRTGEHLGTAPAVLPKIAEALTTHPCRVTQPITGARDHQNPLVGLPAIA